MTGVVLGDLIKPARVSRAGDSDYPLLSMTMHEGLVDQSTKFKKRVASDDVSSYKVIRRGQLVVGFPIDEGVLDFQTLYDEAIASPAYGVWDLTDEASVHRPYLKRFLRSGPAMAYYKAKLRGSTARRRSLPNEVFLALPVPFPPIDEQRRIAAILDQADALRAKRRQVLAHLDSLSQSIFHDMFGAESFPVVRARELMPFMRNGLSPATAGTYPAEVLTLSAVTQGRFDPTAVKSGRFAIEPPADKRVTAMDFLMCRGSGNKTLVGVGAYSVEDRPDLVFPDTVIAGRIDPTKVTMPFLCAVWQQRHVRNQIESFARTTNGTYKVNQQAISSVTVPLPPPTLQQEFGARIEAIEMQRAAVRGALAADEELFTSLQSRAFRGEL